MDMSFANQALSAEYISKNAGSSRAEVYVVPEDIDREIARLKLATMDVDIDKLTAAAEEVPLVLAVRHVGIGPVPWRGFQGAPAPWTLPQGSAGGHRARPDRGSIFARGGAPMATDKIVFGTDGWRAVIAEDYTFDEPAHLRGRRSRTSLKRVGPSSGCVIALRQSLPSPRTSRPRPAQVMAANGIKAIVTDRADADASHSRSRSSTARPPAA